MALRRVRAPHLDFTALRRELALPERFGDEAQREAERAATGAAVSPAGGAAVGRAAGARTDHTDIPFVTIDPATSLDLDQAMCLQRRAGGGYRVYYAIADVASFVAPGGALDTETWRRGQTVHLPDGRVPLHPLVGVQSDVDAGRAPDPVALLPEIGKLLVARGLARGAINLPSRNRRSSATAGPGACCTGRRNRSRSTTPRSRC